MGYSLSNASYPVLRGVYAGVYSGSVGNCEAVRSTVVDTSWRRQLAAGPVFRMLLSVVDVVAGYLFACVA